MECKAIPSDEIISSRRIDCRNRLKTEPSEDCDRKKTKRAWSQKSNNGMIEHIKYNRSSDMKSANWSLDLANDDLDISVS